jgi:hypothetical protein
MIKFSLTFEWPDKSKVTAFKSFNTTHKGQAWALARRWQNNCLAICGKNESGQSVSYYGLEIVQ